MAIFVTSTTVVTNTPSINWDRIANAPAGIIRGLNRVVVGDGSNPVGGAQCRLDNIAFNPTDGILTVIFDTDCDCDCDCDCACDCNCDG